MEQVNRNEENIKLINSFIIYMKEKYGIDYLNDPRYIGMMYYGSRLTGNYNKTSDLDLCIICDSASEKKYKGVININGIDVEYIEQTEESIYTSINNDYKRKNSFPKSAYSRAYIVFEKDDCVSRLKQYIYCLFDKGFELPLNGEIFDDLALIDSRVSDLKKLDESNDKSFDLMYYTLLDRVKTFFHRMNNISKIEIYKAVRAYKDSAYKETALGIDTPIDEYYISLFLQCFNSNGLTNEEKLKRLDDLVKYIKASYVINSNNIEFEIYKRAPFYQSRPVILNDMRDSLRIDLNEKGKNCIEKFIEIKKLQEMKEYVGIFVYQNNSDNEKEVEMIVLLDSSSEKMYKGSCIIDGITIKYVMVHDKYMLDNSYVDNRPCPYKINQQGFLIPNNITYSIVANEDNMNKIEDFVSRLFEQNFRKIDFSKYSSEMIVIDNRMKRLESFIGIDDCNYFDMYYYIIMAKMINAYRNKIGSCYIDSDDTLNKIFIDCYNASLECRENKQARFDLLNNLYKFLKGNIEISVEERVDITPRNRETIKGPSLVKKK